MIHFTNFFALLVGGMEVIQPAAAVVLADLSPRVNLGLMNMFQRRQGNAPPLPPQCVTICDPVGDTIASIATTGCSPALCCTNSFETSLFNCLTCVESVAGVSDYTADQVLLDKLYDECANNGTALLNLTFPGQDPNRPLSSVVSSISTVSSTSSLPAQSSNQPIFDSSTSSTPATTPSQSTVTSVNTPTPTPTSSSTSSAGIRSVTVEKSYFNLITVTMMLGTWLYFGAY